MGLAHAVLVSVAVLGSVAVSVEEVEVEEVEVEEVEVEEVEVWEMRTP